MQGRNGSHRPHQEGAALFVAVMILAMMGALGIMAFNTVLVDRQVAGFQNRAKTAFYAAEAGAAEGRSLIRDASPFSLPALNPRALGDTALYDREVALPSYSGDPAGPFAPNSIVNIGRRTLRGGNLQGGGSLVELYWQINVQGQSPDGSTARIEVVEAEVLSGNYN